ncbi:RimK/LysX family protein [Halobaculum sp. MBLA0147]|uniref:ATP-grasp domain-containing protein n=1 Tax=Halobaculum sp. MBLA0147 TaxID=3079934 RepID=UPI0035242A74
MSDGVRVGVLSLHNSKETKAICNAVAALGHEPLWLRAENLRVEAGYGTVTVEPEPDVVINRLLLPAADQPLTELGLAGVFDAVDVPVCNPASATATATHKFAAMARLAAEGLPVPPSVLRIGAHRLERTHLPDDPAADDFAEQAETSEQTETTRVTETNEQTAPGTRVFKRPVGTHGDETTMLRPGEYAPQTAAASQGIVQGMVESPSDDHEDVRIYVVGGEAVGAMRRYAPDDDWRTNVARGGRVRDATPDVPEDVMQLAVDAADALELDYAGVDVIEGVDGWYVLEVNVTAGFKGFFEATGISPAPAIAAHAIRRVDGVVDDQQVAELATRLDDTVPDCRPPLDPSPEPTESTLGYTTEVRVAGTQGAETVVAKADTGATRTSVDVALAGEVGAGPIDATVDVKGDGNGRPVVPVGIRLGDYTHRVRANVRDRSHLAHDVLLGRDVLDDYSVRVSRRHDDDETDPPDFVSGKHPRYETEE